jgi:multidrug efflux system membrane fusion protein
MLITAISVTGCGGEPIRPAPPLPVTVQAAGTAANGTSGAFSANVVADLQVDLAFKVNGYVQSILQTKGADGRMRNVQTGDFVTAGVVLATLKDETYRQNFLRAKSELENARATLVKAKADYGRYSHLLKEGVVARADYDTYKQRADSARAAVDSAQAVMQGAQVDFDGCKLKSPIKGLVLSRSIEVGTLVAANTIGFQIGDTCLWRIPTHAAAGV